MPVDETKPGYLSPRQDVTFRLASIMTDMAVHINRCGMKYYRFILAGYPTLFYALALL